MEDIDIPSAKIELREMANFPLGRHEKADFLPPTLPRSSTVHLPSSD